MILTLEPNARSQQTMKSHKISCVVTTNGLVFTKAHVIIGWAETIVCACGVGIALISTLSGNALIFGAPIALYSGCLFRLWLESDRKRLYFVQAGARRMLYASYTGPWPLVVALAALMSGIVVFFLASEGKA